jgi:hypothetical protein
VSLRSSISTPELSPPTGYVDNPLINCNTQLTLSPPASDSSILQTLQASPPTNLPDSPPFTFQPASHLSCHPASPPPNHPSTASPKRIPPTRLELTYQPASSPPKPTQSLFPQARRTCGGWPSHAVAPFRRRPRPQGRPLPIDRSGLSRTHPARTHPFTAAFGSLEDAGLAVLASCDRTALACFMVGQVGVQAGREVSSAHVSDAGLERLSLTGRVGKRGSGLD